MTYPFQFGTSAQRLDETEAQAFFRLLTHNDQNSLYCIACNSEQGKWTESFVRASRLVNFSIFDSSADCYVSRNGFNKPSRKTEHLRQINALMFDLDCHKGDARKAVALGLAALREAVCAKRLPEPNLLVDTGRGLHVYYVLDRSTAYRLRDGQLNEKGLAFFRDVEAKLSAPLVQALANTGLELDTAVRDFARVGRIPGTFNHAAGCFARLAHLNEQVYSLSDLSRYGVKPARKSAPASPQKTCMIAFDKLSLSRVNKIFALQKLRGEACLGHRELMSFCLYNAAVQIFQDKDDARNTLIKFNQNFSQPLEPCVLDQIVSSVGKVGFYKMSAATMADKLGLSAEEIAQTHFFESRRSAARTAAKAATASKRATRNAQIIRLYAQPKATYESVARAVGVCVRTVASVIRASRTTAPASCVLISLKDAAQKALEARTPQACKFLANVFKAVSCSSSSYRFLSVPFASARVAYPPGFA